MVNRISGDGRIRIHDENHLQQRECHKDLHGSGRFSDGRGRSDRPAQPVQLFLRMLCPVESLIGIEELFRVSGKDDP